MELVYDIKKEPDVWNAFGAMGICTLRLAYPNLKPIKPERYWFGCHPEELTMKSENGECNLSFSPKLGMSGIGCNFLYMISGGKFIFIKSDGSRRFDTTQAFPQTTACEVAALSDDAMKDVLISGYPVDFYLRAITTDYIKELVMYELVYPSEICNEESIKGLFKRAANEYHGIDIDKMSVGDLYSFTKTLHDIDV